MKPRNFWIQKGFIDARNDYNFWTIDTENVLLNVPFNIDINIHCSDFLFSNR